MKLKTALCRLGMLLPVLLTLSLFSFSQNNFKVTGKVNDELGKPLEGVTVQVKGTNIATATSADGSFTINAPSGTSTLIITSVGFIQQEIALNNKTELTMSLINAASALQEVVVGYGTRKKVEVTGAVSSISGDNLRSVPTTNISQALQGRLPGVVATPNSFRPGAGSSIRIRGSRSLSASNEPLYVVDGFPVSYTIDDMNPADVESIDILKDASATAIYGVRGANGVVQITTRKGKTGKVSVTYMGSKSYDEIIRPLPIFNSVEIADAWRQAFFADKNIRPRSKQCVVIRWNCRPNKPHCIISREH
jgi:TonB-dependent SusC/RagA subfamily outer membrane receptor